MSDSSAFDDWGGMGLPGDTGGDTVDVGNGGDPYGSSDGQYADSASEDTDPTGGVLSGGLMGTGDSVYPGLVRNAGLTILGRPGGNALYQTSDPAVPNLGVYPMAPPPNGAGALSSAAKAGAIICAIRQATGLRVSARSVVGLIIKYGFAAASQLTRADLHSLLFLFMRQKGVRHHRRGPGLYTISRRLRAADSLRAHVSRVLGRGGHSHRRHHRGRVPAAFRRRHRRR